MWRNLLEEVRTEHLRFDAEVAEWQTGYARRGGRIHCRRGCRNCCSLAVHATFTEALCVADIAAVPDDGLGRHVQKLVAAARTAADLGGWLRGHRLVGACPFLREDGACGVYQQRPFACRALLSTRNADWCGVDLNTLHPLERQAFLSGLDPSEVDFPSHYAARPREDGAARESRSLRRMAETFGFSLAGNLPCLVWLEREHRLSAVFPQGAAAVADLLRSKDLAIPLLFDLRDRDFGSVL